MRRKFKNEALVAALVNWVGNMLLPIFWSIHCSRKHPALRGFVWARAAFLGCDSESIQINNIAQVLIYSRHSSTLPATLNTVSVNMLQSVSCWPLLTSTLIRSCTCLFECRHSLSTHTSIFILAYSICRVSQTQRLCIYVRYQTTQCTASEGAPQATLFDLVFGSALCRVRAPAVTRLPPPPALGHGTCFDSWYPRCVTRFQKLETNFQTWWRRLADCTTHRTGISRAVDSCATLTVETNVGAAMSYVLGHRYRSKILP